MAAPAMQAIANITLGAASASVTFSNIPQTYRDLYVVISGQTTGALNNVRVQYNGDTNSNYIAVRMLGDGSSASSASSGSQAFVQWGDMGALDTIITGSVLDYSATDKNKTSLVRGNNAGSGGGSNGGDGQGTDHSGSATGSTGGGGGTQTYNGAGGAGFNTAANFGSPGSGFQGGAPSYQCGGGGAGYYGGGGGGYSINDSTNSAGGGGGGSSLVANLTGTIITVSGGGAVFPDPGTLTFTYAATPPGVVNILAGITNINSSDAINMTTNAINTDTDLFSLSTITTNIKSTDTINLSTTQTNITTSTMNLQGYLYTNVVSTATTFVNRRMRCITVDTGGGDFWDSTGILYANTTGVANFTNSDSPTGGFEYACYDAVFSLAGFDGTLDAYNLTLTGCYVTPAVNSSGNWFANCRATALPGTPGPPPTYHTKWYVTGIFFPKTLGAN